MRTSTILQSLLLAIPIWSTLGFQSTTPFAALGQVQKEQQQVYLRASTNDVASDGLTESESNRRSFMKNLVMGGLGSVIATSSFSGAAFAEEGEDSLTDVYFGVGCYWHIQHEFVEAERKLLGRGDKELTSRTGYAGGTATDKEGRVCYHNFQGVADYGKLGHGEVVGMRIPQTSIGDFAKEYFDLFTAKGERVDPMDRGGEYRSLLGLPNGANNPAYPAVEAAATAKGMTLRMGKGNDPDTLGTKSVFVYDTAKFPFYQAEVYHQFHNDFQSPAYGKKYNSLQQMAFDDGRLKITGCPDKV
jgi:peptide methionine sulfoxide reductase MsrA